MEASAQSRGDKGPADKKPLNAISASPDGNQIVAGGRDGMY